MTLTEVLVDVKQREMNHSSRAMGTGTGNIGKSSRLNSQGLRGGMNNGDHTELVSARLGLL
jgi:hypothetical protein